MVLFAFIHVTSERHFSPPDTNLRLYKLPNVKGFVSTSLLPQVQIPPQSSTSNDHGTHKHLSRS